MIKRKFTYIGILYKYMSQLYLFSVYNVLVIKDKAPIKKAGVK